MKVNESIMRAMFDKLPDLIDPVYSAQHHKRFASRVNQSRFKRLSEALVEANNDMEVDAMFYRHPRLGLPALDLRVSTQLKLQCQRSLKTFEYPVKFSLTGVFVETLALADDVPSEIEVYELAEEKISLVDLIEEEILLNIPMVPVDSTSKMSYENEGELVEEMSENEEPEKKTNPFAVLKELQIKD